MMTDDSGVVSGRHKQHEERHLALTILLEIGCSVHFEATAWGFINLADQDASNFDIGVELDE